MAQELTNIPMANKSNSYDEQRQKTTKLSYPVHRRYVMSHVAPAGGKILTTGGHVE